LASRPPLWLSRDHEPITLPPLVAGPLRNKSKSRPGIRQCDSAAMASPSSQDELIGMLLAIWPGSINNSDGVRRLTVP
jgi:hypothetical protein